ncbi:PLP-dependent aminotransferase family protein [bacterium]|nr:PLP-dependent aminotransferase family protein [bacterium]
MRNVGGRRLDVHVDRASDVPVYQQIYREICAFVSSGALVGGDRLPSLRQLAQDAGVSRPTVERAYLQLEVEGYVENEPRSGFVVRPLDARFLQTTATSAPTAPPKEPAGRGAFFSQFGSDARVMYDFAFAQLPEGSFPSDVWLSAARDVMRDEPGLAAHYLDESRPSHLQRSLCAYLRRARGITCDPTQVVIMPGTAAAIARVLRLFAPRDGVVAGEEPGYRVFPDVSRGMGFRVVGVPSDQGAQAFLDGVQSSGASLLFVTPSHQFPTGEVMRADVRAGLLAWAHDGDAWVLEDDSCSEYRYDVDPVPSLQSLDGGRRVIYLGNFSKTLSPALRVAYLVIPPDLMSRYYDAFSLAMTEVSVIEQELLARLIDGGEYERHVRRLGTRLRHGHDALLDALLREFDGTQLELRGANAGMHLFATVCNGMGYPELLASALAQGARVYAAEPYWFTRAAPRGRLLLGFSAIAVKDVAPGVAALRRAWFPRR